MQTSKTGIFVKKAFQDLTKPEKIKELDGLRYHETAVLNAQKFQENYESLSRGVEYNPNQKI